MRVEENITSPCVHYDCTDKLSRYVARSGQLWNFRVSVQLFAGKLSLGNVQENQSYLKQNAFAFFIFIVMSKVKKKKI